MRSGKNHAADARAVRRDRGDEMEIRRLKQEEHNSTRALYEEIFHEDSREFVDYYYREKTADNSIYVVEAKGCKQAMIHLNPYTLLVNGHEVPAHYIVAVATKKECRRRGYMAALLKRTLQDMLSQSEPFTFLMPAAESIYLPHGFRTVYEQEQRYVGREEAKTLGFKEAVPEDCTDIAESVNAYLKEHYHVYAKRDTAYYKRLLKEYESDGGCLMLQKKEGRLSDVRPCVEGPEEAMPKIMIRIVCLEQMMKLMEVSSTMEACFCVTDPIIPDNNKCLLVTGTESSGVMLAEGEPGSSEGTVTVSALGELLFGSRTPEELSGDDGVVMPDKLKKELAKIVPLKKIFLNEIV